ncbi:uncharacterized protein LOC142332937 [Lycorma delicatula]|uniref:uncharacterized protein LOC142332937 n=1 Tax=Lycorma delicatula TaxID=130591 RepID=UPI003F515B23
MNSYNNDKVTDWLASNFNYNNITDNTVVSNTMIDETSNLIFVSQHSNKKKNTNSSNTEMFGSGMKVYQSKIKLNKKQLRCRQLPQIFNNRKQNKTSVSVVNLKHFINSIDCNCKSKVNTNIDNKPKKVNQTINLYESLLHSSKITDSDIDWSLSKDIDQNTFIKKQKNNCTKLHLKSIYSANKKNQLYKQLFDSKNDEEKCNSKNVIKKYKTRTLPLKNKNSACNTHKIKNKNIIYKARCVGQANEIFNELTNFNKLLQNNNGEEVIYKELFTKKESFHNNLVFFNKSPVHINSSNVLIQCMQRDINKHNKIMDVQRSNFSSDRSENEFFEKNKLIVNSSDGVQNKEYVTNLNVKNNNVHGCDYTSLNCELQIDVDYCNNILVQSKNRDSNNCNKLTERKTNCNNNSLESNVQIFNTNKGVASQSHSDLQLEKNKFHNVFQNKSLEYIKNGCSVDVAISLSLDQQGSINNQNGLTNARDKQVVLNSCNFDKSKQNMNKNGQSFIKKFYKIVKKYENNSKLKIKKINVLKSPGWSKLHDSMLELNVTSSTSVMNRLDITVSRSNFQSIRRVNSIKKNYSLNDIPKLKNIKNLFFNNSTNITKSLSANNIFEFYKSNKDYNFDKIEMINWSKDFDLFYKSFITKSYDMAIDGSENEDETNSSVIMSSQDKHKKSVIFNNSVIKLQHICVNEQQCSVNKSFDIFQYHDDNGSSKRIDLNEKLTGQRDYKHTLPNEFKDYLTGHTGKSLINNNGQNTSSDYTNYFLRRTASSNSIFESHDGDSCVQNNKVLLIQKEVSSNNSCSISNQRQLIRNKHHEANNVPFYLMKSLSKNGDHLFFYKPHLKICTCYI